MFSFPLSTVGWINGITISFIFLFTIPFGLFCIYQANKSKAKLLYYLGFVLIFGGLAWVGNFADFLTILFTGRNVDNTYGFVGISCEIWFAPAYVFSMLLVVEILKLKGKKYIIFIYIVLGVIYEIFLILDPGGSLTYIYPSTPGEDLIEDNIVIESPVGIIFLIFAFSFIIFGVFGTFIKGIQSEGVVRKKFFIFSTGGLLVSISAILDSQIEPGFFLIFIRLLFSLSYIFIYLVVREEPEIKIASKKKTRVEGDLFRLSSTRPKSITDEELALYRERFICLVCKGNALNFTFICPGCKALYCVNCAQALIKIENACWSCNAPIDKSLPVKPFVEEKEDLELEISEDLKKK